MNTSTDRRIAVIGLGAMGGAMAATLHRAGWEVTGFDPSEAARAAAADAGIRHRCRPLTISPELLTRSSPCRPPHRRDHGAPAARGTGNRRDH